MQSSSDAAAPVIWHPSSLRWVMWVLLANHLMVSEFSVPEWVEVYSSQGSDVTWWG